MSATEPVLACFLEARLSTHDSYNLYCSRHRKLYNGVHNGKHSKVPPLFRKATLKLINFSGSNRNIWLPGIVVMNIVTSAAGLYFVASSIITSS